MLGLSARKEGNAGKAAVWVGGLAERSAVGAGRLKYEVGAAAVLTTWGGGRVGEGRVGIGGLLRVLVVVCEGDGKDGKVGEGAADAAEVAGTAAVGMGGGAMVVEEKNRLLRSSAVM